MTKAEKLKLHRILTKLNKGLENVVGNQKVQQAQLKVIEEDIKNLFHVVKETQDQQRRSTPDLKLVKGNGGPKTPRRNR